MAWTPGNKEMWPPPPLRAGQPAQRTSGSASVILAGQGAQGFGSYGGPASTTPTTSVSLRAYGGASTTPTTSMSLRPEERRSAMQRQVSSGSLTVAVAGGVQRQPSSGSLSQRVSGGVVPYIATLGQPTQLPDSIGSSRAMTPTPGGRPTPLARTPVEPGPTQAITSVRKPSADANDDKAELDRLRAALAEAQQNMSRMESATQLRNKTELYSEQEIQDLRSALHRLENEVATSTADYAELDRMESDLAKKDNDITDLKDRLTRLESSVPPDFIDHVDLERFEAKAERSENTMRKELEMVHAEQAAQTAADVENRAEMAALNDEKKELADIVLQMSQELTELKGEKKDLQGSVKDLLVLGKSDDKEQDIQRANERIRELERFLAAADDEVATLQASVKAHLEEKERTEEAIKRAAHLEAIDSGSLAQRDERIAQLESLLNDANDSIAARRASLAKRDQWLAEVKVDQAQIEELNQQLQERDRRIMEIEGAVQQHADKAHAAGAIERAAMDQLHRELSAAKQVEVEVEHYRQETFTWRQAASDAEQNASNQSASIKEKDERIAHLERELSASKKTADEAVQHLSSLMLNSKATEQRVAQLERELSESDKAANDAAQNASGLRSAHSELREEKNERIAQLDSELCEARKALDHAEQTVDDAQRKVASAAEQAAQKDVSHASAIKERDEFISELEKRLHDADQYMNARRASQEAHVSGLKESQDVADRLQAVVTERDAQIKALEAELGDSKATAEGAVRDRERIKQLEQEVDDLRAAQNSSAKAAQESHALVQNEKAVSLKHVERIKQLEQEVKDAGDLCSNLVDQERTAAAKAIDQEREATDERLKQLNHELDAGKHTLEQEKAASTSYQRRIKELEDSLAGAGDQVKELMRREAKINEAEEEHAQERIKLKHVQNELLNVKQELAQANAANRVPKEHRGMQTDDIDLAGDKTQAPKTVLKFGGSKSDGNDLEKKISPRGRVSFAAPKEPMSEYVPVRKTLDQGEVQEPCSELGTAWGGGRPSLTAGTQDRKSRISIPRVSIPGEESDDDTRRRRRSTRPTIEALVEQWDSDWLQEQIREIFDECDTDNSAYLGWGNGQCRVFLVKFFERHGLPPPEMPLVVFRQIYNEVKLETGNNSISGLDLRECSIYAKRVHSMIRDFMPELQQQKAERRKSRLLSVTSMEKGES